MLVIPFWLWFLEILSKIKVTQDIYYIYFVILKFLNLIFITRYYTFGYLDIGFAADTIEFVNSTKFLYLTKKFDIYCLFPRSLSKVAWKIISSTVKPHYNAIQGADKNCFVIFFWMPFSLVIYRTLCKLMRSCSLWTEKIIFLVLLRLCINILKNIFLSFTRYLTNYIESVGINSLILLPFM